MIQKKAWSLNPKDVGLSGIGGTSGQRKQATKAGRSTTTTRAAFKLTHYPTNLYVEGEIPPGNYSRTEMKKKKEELYNILFQKLEVSVAKHLKVSGR